MDIESAELQKLLMEQAQVMPNKARRVVEYLLTNMREASFRSIGDIADELSVSKAQLVRVAQMLGFTGYAELKAHLQRMVLEQINPAALLEKAGEESDNSMVETVFRAERANLEDTKAQLNAESVDKFDALAKEAGNIYCIGWGISGLVAEELHVRLTVMGCRSILCRRGGLSLWEQVRGVRKGDLVIVCELPSYVHEVTEAVELAANNGAKIVTLTDSAAAPVCRYAALSFNVSAKSPTFGSSTIGALLVIHALTSSLALALGDKAKKAFDVQAELLHDERIFHPIFGLKY